jgi:hypothetical protein
MPRRSNNYSSDSNTSENQNVNDKYSETGESEFSRESTIPYDQDEVLSERHYNMSTFDNFGKHQVKRREAPPLTEKNFRGRGPRGYRRSDETIREDVCEALYRSSAVDASEIDVSISEGHVTLKGFVATREQKKAAESAIENLAGVDDVYNEIRLRSEAQNIPKGKNGLIDNITGMN